MNPTNPPPMIVAGNTPLAIEFTDGLSAKCDARLDLDDHPRYISVNRNLPQYEQVFATTRI